ncbi:MAG: ion transporter [Deltaproteobacteria bacterium]
MPDLACDTDDPASQPASVTHPELGPYQMFMFGLGVYVLLALAAQTFLPLSESTDAILDHVDDGICVIFFFDFFISLHRAPSKLGYLKWGWIDLLSSIPMVDMFRAGRIARIIRILRAFRGVRSGRFLADYLVHHRANGAFFAVALLSILLVLFSSISILQFENTREGNIRTPQDALWWAFATVTTVGYGDKFPVTTEGRMVAAVLMTAGVGMFGSFTGLVASWILTPTKKDTEQDSELARLRERVEAIQRHLTGGEAVEPAGDPRDAAELAQLAAAWPSLPAHVKARILADATGPHRGAA